MALKISIFLVAAGLGLGALGLTLIGATVFTRFIFAGSTPTAASCGDSPCREPVRYTLQALPTPPPTATATISPTRIAPARSLAEPLPLTATVALTPTSTPTITPTATPSPERVMAVESYTSTAQVAPPPTASPTPTAPPMPTPVCPISSTAQFDLIPIEGPATRDYPDNVHGDLNLALRGYIPASGPLERIDYNGSTDDNAPRLHGLFEPNRQAQITSLYRVNDWEWNPDKCGGHPRGCPAPPSDKDYWPVTLVGLATTPGEPIYIPERGPEIYPGGYIAMVLYAEEQRLTLGYTRRDVVSAGYTVHLENMCVNPNLVALYRAQMDAEGWHVSGHLPALRNNQALGTALGAEIRVAVRDVGTFMDPRSQKDWWR